MYDIIEQAHKHRRVDKADNYGELIEVSEEISKEIENIILLPSNENALIKFHYSQTWKGNPFIEEKGQECKEEKSSKEICCKLPSNHKFRVSNKK